MVSGSVKNPRSRIEEVHMSSDLAGTSLIGYGAEIYEKYHYTCVYCGFDGRPFDSWMQLSIDHILPKSMGGKDDPSNLVVACRACNSITSRMSFRKDQTPQEIVVEKRQRVLERRREFYEHWSKTVAPRYLDRPLPEVKKKS
jgi:5-methylcytosine-specific restriction endonuclease McrA